MNQIMSAQGKGTHPCNGRLCSSSTCCLARCRQRSVGARLPEKTHWPGHSL